MHFWDDPWQSISGPPGPQTDLHIFLYNSETGLLMFPGEEPNANGDATEAFVLAEGGYDIVKWITRGLGYFDPLGLGISATNTATRNAPGTAAVGAASEKQTFSELLLQPFSSLGGIPLLFDDDENGLPEELVLKQPRFVGPDG
jgi:hypothetical protein